MCGWFVYTCNHNTVSLDADEIIDASYDARATTAFSHISLVSNLYIKAEHEQLNLIAYQPEMLLCNKKFMFYNKQDLEWRVSIHVT